MQTILLKEGDTLYSVGVASDFVYFVESGEVEVRRADESGGDPIPVAVLGVVRSLARWASSTAYRVLQQQ